ncbi:putative leader peptide [Streptomyces sp. NPDC050263]|uniref:putative leader peptide n=1 Tax=Streptomyces sp. NPDC050263 TaxID=3155037 RepID=UPI003417E9F3
MLCPPYEHPLGVDGVFCHDPHHPGRKTRDLWGGAMRTLDLVGRMLPLLTSRRHIDLGRVSSAICRPLRRHSA